MASPLAKIRICLLQFCLHGTVTDAGYPIVPEKSWLEDNNDDCTRGAYNITHPVYVRSPNIS